MIVEMAGKPATHVRETLEKHVGVLNELEDVTVRTIKISEPKIIEVPDEVKNLPNREDMFSCFTEIDLDVNNLAKLSELMFDFMPSSVEVIEPAKLHLELSEATDLLNNISGRMHRYDEVARMAQGRIYQLSSELEKSKRGFVDGGNGHVQNQKEVNKMVKKKAAKKTKKKAAKKTKKKAKRR